ncbi:hypothetical protein [Mesorhizobium sp. NZP2234]|nr:hypothetical protein [Mesorhizobium sp. NZP2234]
METVFAHFDAIDLTENHVTQLHRDLLAFSNKDELIAAPTRHSQTM